MRKALLLAASGALALSGLGIVAGSAPAGAEPVCAWADVVIDGPVIHPEACVPYAFGVICREVVIGDPAVVSAGACLPT
jgi:hypothetical protein